MTKKYYYIAAIVTVTLLTTGFHFTNMRTYSPYVVLEELYYLPLLLGISRPKPAVVLGGGGLPVHRPFQGDLDSDEQTCPH